MTEDEVLVFCQALSRYKRPRCIYFGEAPRNPTGKIEKPKLRERYAGAKEKLSGIGLGMIPSINL